MPSDNLILNVRQIAGYPEVTAAQPGDTLLLQRGGLGGPYQSITAANTVSTALASSGSMWVHDLLQAGSIHANQTTLQNSDIVSLTATTATIDSLSVTDLLVFDGQMVATQLWVYDAIGSAAKQKNRVGWRRMASASAAFVLRANDLASSALNCSTPGEVSDKACTSTPAASIAATRPSSTSTS